MLKRITVSSCSAVPPSVSLFAFSFFSTTESLRTKFGGIVPHDSGASQFQFYPRIPTLRFCYKYHWIYPSRLMRAITLPIFLFTKSFFASLFEKTHNAGQPYAARRYLYGAVVIENCQHFKTDNGKKLLSVST